MAEVVNDAYLSINSVDLSDHVKSLSGPLARVMQDATAMGSDSEIFIAGLMQYSMDVEFFQDFASAKVDDTIWAIYTAGSSVTITWRKSKTDAVSATNPEYSFTGTVESYTPIAGSVGETLMAPVSLKPTSDSIARATS